MSPKVIETDNSNVLANSKETIKKTSRPNLSCCSRLSGARNFVGYCFWDLVNNRVNLDFSLSRYSQSGQVHLIYLRLIDIFMSNALGNEEGFTRILKTSVQKLMFYQFGHVKGKF